MNFQLLPLNPCGLAQFKRDMRTYPAGTRVRLLVMDDSHASPAGTLGTVIGRPLSQRTPAQSNPRRGPVPRP